MARVAFVVDETFEDSEFRVPYDLVQSEGHDAVVVGLSAGKKLEGKKGNEKITTEQSVEDVSADDFDAVVIPGGYSPDHLRTSADAVRLVRDAFEQGKPVAAICHAGWMLIEAGIVDGKTVTSWLSVKTDLENAGATWVDRDVVEDGNIITSRKPDDLPAFCAALMGQIQRASATREPSFDKQRVA